MLKDQEKNLQVNWENEDQQCSGSTSKLDIQDKNNFSLNLIGNSESTSFVHDSKPPVISKESI